MRADIKLVPPKANRSPNYSIRGTYLGYYVDRSAKTGDRKTANKVFAKIKREIERGEFQEREGMRFGDAAIRYMNAGGERQFMAPILTHIGTTVLAAITQEVIDDTATALCAGQSPASANRKVYTPISAVLRHAGVALAIRRPRGAQGQPRKHWLRPEQAEQLIAAAWRTHPRFAALLTFLLYTGCRLSEALRLQVEDIDFGARFADLPKTKNGEPQRVNLPPVVVEALRRALLEPGNATWDRPKTHRSTGSVFCLTKSGALYALLTEIEEAAGVAIPDGVSFHIFRHTFGAWTRAAGGKLEETGRWTSRAGAAPYNHYAIDEAQRVADRFPGAAGTAGEIKEVG